MIELSVTIMNSAFSMERVMNVERIIDKLGKETIQKYWKKFEVIRDFEKKGAWYVAKKCWLFGACSNSTHHLVLQDDIDVSKNFVQGILKIIEACPQDILTLSTFPRKNFTGKTRWGLIEGVYGQGIVMPKEKLIEFLNWQDKHILSNFPHDDSRISLFCKYIKYPIKVPFPNPIQHLDNHFKSTMGNKWNRPRISENYIGNNDPLTIDWSDDGVYEKSINSFPPKKYYDYLIDL